MNVTGIVLSLIFAGAAGTASRQADVVIENAQVRYTLSSGGENLGFVDLATGTDYLKRDAASVCAFVKCGGKEYRPTSVSLADGHLTIRFGEVGVEAVLGVESRDSYLRVVVESVSGQVESLTFLNIPLTVQGRPEEPFGACALSLNLITHVDPLPALQTLLRATCYQKFGLVGAKVAIAGASRGQMLDALKQALTDADEMPHCPVAGPWAREIPFNHGSYLFNFGSLTESTADEWIASAKNLGVTQIDNHGGGSAFFRFGDFALNPKKWPQGWDTYRRIVQRLHDAGIGSIFHTYAFFIDKQSKYVTPVPDKRLDAFRTFTLTSPVDADAAEIEVNESSKGMTTITGFFEHNSVVLHIDDELVTFSRVSQEPPWRFSGLTRGAFGTRRVSHEKGAKARHLKECFGLFVPDVESSLFEEIAANHAEVVNVCGFDGIYLDAIDGCSILRGPDECWYWGDRFVFEIQKRLKKPVGMEMSAMWHHCWQYRTRWQAWDYPQRGQKRFIDIHAAAVNGGLLLPLHLGWWNFQGFTPPQVEPTYPDVAEYLGAKLIGWDAGISLTGAVDQASLTAVPLFRKAVDILRTCEELRIAGSFDESVKARLREPGKDFTLFRDAAGAWRFRPAHYAAHTAAVPEPWSLSWRAANPFREQPAKFRIEALMSAASYDDPGNIVLLDLSEPNTPAPSCADGVTAKVAIAPSSGAFIATSSGKVAPNAAWARLDRKFDSPANLKGHQALGVWVEGDGLGEILAIRLDSPRHISFGALADRYIPVDFTGRRFLTLVETESARWSDYVWNDGKWHYNAYRETIDFAAVESVSLLYNNLPQGKEVRCVVGPVKAMAMVPCTVKNPVLTVNGKTLSFPVEIPSGGRLEFDGSERCTLYGPKGETLAQVTPAGAVPLLVTGDNQVRFSCDPADGPSPRVKVTIISHGDPL
jgi:archaellum component FlaG (FlaF/FlaG flagellin family)